MAAALAPPRAPQASGGGGTAARDLLLRGVLAHQHCQVRRTQGALGRAYATPMDFVLREGQPYAYVPLPLADQMALGMCYGNSLMAAICTGLRYVEGYAMLRLAGAPPVVWPHAWVTDGTHAYDPTWPAPGGLAYLGVEFSVERADNCTWVGDGSVLHDPHRGYPLLQVPWDGEAAAPAWPASPWLTLARQGRWPEAFRWSQEHRHDP